MYSKRRRLKKTASKIQLIIQNKLITRNYLGSYEQLKYQIYFSFQETSSRDPFPQYS